MKKRHLWIIILVFISFFSFACGHLIEKERIEREEIKTREAEEAAQEAQAATLEAKTTPTMLATMAQESYDAQSPRTEFESVVAGSHEYAVEGANLNSECVCSGIANLTVDLNFVGNQLEFSQAGMETTIYDKTAPNTYERTFLQKYLTFIIEDGKEKQTEAEGESRQAIILNQSGFIREQYGIAGITDSNSACCYHSFNIVK